MFYRIFNNKNEVVAVGKFEQSKTSINDIDAFVKALESANLKIDIFEYESEEK